MALVSVAVPYGVGFAKSKKKSADGETKPKEARLRGPKPSEMYAAIAENHFLHLHYFQKIGPSLQYWGI